MKRFENILMYAGTGSNSAAISRAVQLAMENDAKLTLLDVIKPIPHAIGLMTDVASPEELEQLVAEEHREKLLAIAADYSDSAITLDAVVRIGKPPIEIVRQVLSGQHDLVIKTANGQSGLGRLFGGTEQALMRTCPCPVWVLKPDVSREFRRVLVALDLETQDPKTDDLNHQLLDLGHSVAVRDDAELHIVSAWEVWMEQSLRRRAGREEIDNIALARANQIEHSLSHLLKELGIDCKRPQLHLHQGVAERVIHQVARQIDADLLVMGTVSRAGVAGFLIGNTAEHVLAHADCSVLTIKPEGFVTPVTLTDEPESLSDSWQPDVPLV
ncbi:MAG: universal stress protein [Pirellulales bacterium]|nr:universal stress protein [Pirellulales bacterium]